MKKMLSLGFILAMLVFPMSLFAQTTPIVTYTIDPNHTYVMWQISHMGFSTQTGKWHAQGTVEADEINPQQSKIKVNISVADFITGDEKLNEHLRSSEFFDTAKFPTATFVSDKITMTDKKNAQVQGMLTVHGITKPVILDVVIHKQAISPMTQKKTIGFSAKTSIKRSDYGMTAYLPGLSDQVQIRIDGEAYLGQ